MRGSRLRLAPEVAERASLHARAGVPDDPGQRPHLIEGSAVGALVGEGRWRLFEGQGTAVTYEWNVATTRPWMNALAPAGRPLFAWNHDAIMREGGWGLARHLDARLLAQD